MSPQKQSEQEKNDIRAAIKHCLPWRKEKGVKGNKKMCWRRYSTYPCPLLRISKLWGSLAGYRRQLGFHPSIAQFLSPVHHLPPSMPTSRQPPKCRASSSAASTAPAPSPTQQKQPPSSSPKRPRSLPAHAPKPSTSTNFPSYPARSPAPPRPPPPRPSPPATTSSTSRLRSRNPPWAQTGQTPAIAPLRRSRAGCGRAGSSRGLGRGIC